MYEQKIWRRKEGDIESETEIERHTEREREILQQIMERELLLCVSFPSVVSCCLSPHGC